MTLLNLALKNVRQNMSHYMLYFLSTIASIAIYFIFASLKYAPATVLQSESSTKIASGMSSISLVIVIFVAVFIWMTNNFFVRSRKKEIGIYVFSGMKQIHVATLLFLENMIIGLISTALGLAFGALFSRLATMLLVKMMALETFVSFYIAPRAILETSLAFGLIFLLTSTTSAIMVYRFKIIELIQASKSEEKLPSHSKLKAFLGLSLILIGYLDSQLIPVIPQLILFTMLSTLVFTISGTYLFFSSFTLYVLRKLKDNPNHIYKGVNLLSTNHLMFRIRQNSKAMATIAVLSATTITTLGTSLSILEDMNTLRMAYVPHAVQASSDMAHAKEMDQWLESALKAYPFPQSYRINQDLLQFNSLTETTLPNLEDNYFDQAGYILISTSQMKAFYEQDAFKDSPKPQWPKDQEAIFLISNIDSFYMKDWKKDSPFQVALLPPADSNNANGKAMNTLTKLKVVGTQRNQFYPNHLYKHFLLVSDHQYEIAKQIEHEKIALRLIGSNQALKTLALGNAYDALGEQSRESFDVITYGGLQQALNSDRGINLFITIFVCLIFVLASGSVIYFKQITDAVGEVSKYQTLYKIGIYPEEVKKAVSKQLLFMFGAPYLMAVLHSGFALTALSRLLNMSLWHIGAIACGAYLLLYGLFYTATKKSYLKVIG